MMELIKSLFSPLKFQEEDKTQRALLLQNALLTVFLAAIVTPPVFAIFSGDIGLIDWISAYSIAAGAVAGYILLRNRHIYISSVIFICTIYIPVTGFLWFSGSGLSSSFVITYFLALISAALLLTRTAAIITTVLICGTIIALYLFFPGSETVSGLMAYLIVFAASGSLLQAAPKIITVGLDQLRAVNESLRLFAQQQEEQVQERTRDLTLAFNVANNITRIRDLNELLNDSVEQIRAQFDLYYAQIYLTDASERSLNLQAGTGSAGAELTRQGHRLSIGLNSISGEAAYYKKPVTVVDTSKSARHRPNALLPETKSEMAVPLIVNERVLGVLDLQDSQVNGLNESQVQVFQILANQLAGAIENANLFTQVTQTQELLTAQTQLLSRSNWEAYLGNVEDPDRLRAFFSKEGIESESTAVTIHDAMFTTPISVTGETVGFIQIENAPNYQWTDDDANLVKNVASQVAQRIENLRLLYEAERYREEAEQALKRLTRENWEQYLEETPTQEFYFEAGKVHAADTAHLNKPTWQTALQIRGEEVGKLAVKTENPLNEETSELVTAVASQLSAHLENLRLTKQTEQRVAELAIINDINNAVQETQELDALLETVGNRIKQAFNPTTTYIAIYEADKEQISFPYYVIDDAAGYRRPDLEAVSFGTGITSHIIRTGEPTLINDSHEELVRLGAQSVDKTVQPTSFLAVPIHAGTQIVGVASIQNDRSTRRAFGDNDLKLLSTITASIGVAIQNTRLFEQTQQALAEAQRQSHELASINKVIELASTGADMLQTTQLVAEEILKIISVDQIGIAMFLEGETDHLTVVGVADENEDRAKKAKGAKIPVEGNPLTQQVIKTRKTAVVSNAQQDPQTQPIRDLIKEQGFDSLVIIPMLTGDEIIGTIGLASVTKSNQLSAEQIQLAETLVFQTSASFANIRLVDQLGALLQESELQAQRLVKLNQMNATLSQAASINEVYETAVTETAALFQSPYVSFIRLLENTDMGEVMHVHGMDNGMPPGYLINITHEPIGEALLTGQLTQTTADPPLSTITSIPIIARGSIIGSLNLGQTADQKEFDTTDENLLIQVASLLNSIVENKYLLAVTQQRAEKERLINDISQKIQNTVTVENALQVAIEELGRAFKAPYTKVELGVQPDNGPNGANGQA